MAITREQRLEIYKSIHALGSIWGEFGVIDKVQFLNRIWELRLMSSSDPRFKTAAEDQYENQNQHEANIEHCVNHNLNQFRTG